MKRAGYLINDIADVENIRLAYWKAKRGKEAKREVLNFTRDLDENILRISDGLKAGTTEIGNYHYFKIYDPKERVICAASFRERVLHHAIMNICHPHFEHFQIADSYATRIGKGQYAALDRARLFTNKHEWFCKLDIRKYFDSICHELLVSKLERIFKDKHLLVLFRQIIDSYRVTEGRGIPIGNLTSQYFANFYLGFADHYIKEQLHVKAYVRYMDDMVFWDCNKSRIIYLTQRFIKFLETELMLKAKPPCINSSNHGLPFLGYVVFKGKVRLNRNSKKRFFTKYADYSKKLEKELWMEDDYIKHITPLIAFTQYADTLMLRRSMLYKKETC